MPAAKVLPANAVEIGHNKESFCLTFRFQSPDGHLEAVYIVISPSGAKTTADLLNREIQDYEKETGHSVTAWAIANHNNTKNAENHLTA